MFAYTSSSLNKRLAPKAVITIGIGNGFTSILLKRAGDDVVTIDINSSVGRDIYSSLVEPKSRPLWSIFWILLFAVVFLSIRRSTSLNGVFEC